MSGWRALSLRQPWAWIVVHGGKDLENRRWSTRFRGHFLIHAARRMSPEEYEAARLFVARAAGQDAADRVPRAGDLLRGGFMGRARITAVIPPCADAVGGVCGHPWHMPEQHAFQLTDIAPLPFTPYPGALNLFRVPPAVVASLGLGPDA